MLTQNLGTTGATPRVVATHFGVVGKEYQAGFDWVCVDTTHPLVFGENAELNALDQQAMS